MRLVDGIGETEREIARRVLDLIRANAEQQLAAIHG